MFDSAYYRNTLIFALVFYVILCLSFWALGGSQAQGSVEKDVEFETIQSSTLPYGLHRIVTEDAVCYISVGHNRSGLSCKFIEIDPR